MQTERWGNTHRSQRNGAGADFCLLTRHEQTSRTKQRLPCPERSLAGGFHKPARIYSHCSTTPSSWHQWVCERWFFSLHFGINDGLYGQWSSLTAVWLRRRMNPAAPQRCPLILTEWRLLSSVSCTSGPSRFSHSVIFLVLHYQITRAASFPSICMFSNGDLNPLVKTTRWIFHFMSGCVLLNVLSFLFFLSFFPALYSNMVAHISL